MMAREALTIDLTGDSDEEVERPNGLSQMYYTSDGRGSGHQFTPNALSMREYRPPPRQSPNPRTRYGQVPSVFNRPSGHRYSRPQFNQDFPNHNHEREDSTAQWSLKSNMREHTFSRFAAEVTTTCLQCANYPDVSCDGDQPCAPCQAVGDDCIYPGQDPKTVRLHSAPRLGSPDQTQSNTRQPLAERAQPSLLQVDHIDGSDVYGTWNSRSQIDNDGDIEQIDDVDDTSRFDLDGLEGIKDLLHMHEARMRAHREYLTQPLITRAKLECVNSPPVARSSHKGNPFDKLNVNARSKSSGTSKPTLTVQLRSHLAGAPKKWSSESTPLTIVKRDSTILPKYKSIGRLGNVLLARNSYVKKYLPYFADEVPEAERKREEDIAKWYQTDHDSMYRQRSCLELVQLWKPTVEQFISNLEIQFKDILWYILSANVNRRCATCEKAIKRERFAAGLELLDKPDEQSLKRAALACEALEDIAEIHMWHIVAEVDYVKHMIGDVEKVRQPSSSLCSICFVHDCMSHGGFGEPSDDTSGTFAFMGGSGGKRRPMMINDDEKDVNERIPVVVPYRPRHASHLCGVYCVDSTTPIKAVLGRKADGTIGGVYNRVTKVTRPTFDNNEECGPHCFWPVDHRIRFTTVAQTKSFEPSLPADCKTLFMRSLKFFSANQRVPCMLAKKVPGLNCIDAFYYMLAITQNPAHFEQARLDLHEQSLEKASRTVQGIDTSMSSQLDERPPFIPCAHEGPCNEESECPCSEDQVHCEFYCGCDAGCKRRFQGCTCAGKNKVCFNDDRCECWAQNRECDPWVCNSCGAVEVLDPANKYREDIRKGRCKNTNLQLDLPARTIKAPSEVQGWGLYAGQNLEAHTFIGEYKGEIVGNQESDRRGSIYHHLGQEYLFVTNNEQQIDGSNFGNKTRFINNSQRNDYINVLAKKLLCYGVQRVMLYAKRFIKAGDELLYNYNYPDSVTKTFWERGEGPAQVSGAVVAKPVLPSSGRIAKVAETQNGGDRSNSRSRMPTRPKSHQLQNGEDGSRSSSKRKRVSDHEPGVVPAQTAGPVVNDSDPSEYEGVVGETEEDEGEQEIGESGDDSSEDTGQTGSALRKRRIHPLDGRLGGNAQRKAWATRKNRARVSTS